MLIDLTDTTTGEIRGALTRTRDQMGGPTTGHGAEPDHHDRRVRPARRGAGGQPGWPRAPVPGAGRDHPRARAPVPAGRRDPVGRRHAPGQTVLLRLYGPMSQHAGLGGHAAARARHAGGHLVAGLTPGRARRSEPLGALAQRRITDAAQARTARRGPAAALAAGYRPGDTDLSWTRATSVAVAAGRHPGPADTAPSRGGTGRAPRRTTRRADLLTAWLCQPAAGAVPAGRLSGGPGITEVRLEHRRRRHRRSAGPTAGWPP